MAEATGDLAVSIELEDTVTREAFERTRTPGVA
jgi:hypothetical protein